MTTRKLSVVIPAFNEESCIVSTLQDIADTLADKIEYEVVVVDDGSTDKTISLVKEIKDERIKIISLGSNHGKGFAVKEGVLSSVGDYVLFMDADNSTKIEYFFSFLKDTDNYDIIIGSRGLKESIILEHQARWKVFFGKLGAFFIALVLGLKLKDTQCGFKLFKGSVARELFKDVDQSRWGFDFEVLAVAKKKGYSVLEKPVRWENYKSSKVLVKDYPQTLLDLFTVYRKMKKWKN